MTITKILPEAPPESRYGSPLPAVTANGKFVVVLVEGENVSKEPERYFPDFKLKDARGRSYSGEVNRTDRRVQHAMRTIYPMKPYDGDLQPNLAVTHVFVYDVPENARGFTLTAP